MFAEKEKAGFKWIDVIAPDEAELKTITHDYGLHEASIQDWLQADHLPKYERFKDYAFMILRIFDDHNNKEADTVQEVTNKIAIFKGTDFIITLHRDPCSALENVREGNFQRRECT